MDFDIFPLDLFTAGKNVAKTVKFWKSLFTLPCHGSCLATYRSVGTEKSPTK